jgi:NAD(P)H-dependent FMN reductase
MNPPIELVAIIGSLRADSFNRALFQSAQDLVGDGVNLTEASLAEVPLYNGDVEAGGDPEAVASLKAAVDAADALIVFTPEYNRRTPAVTKNAIDWLSRMPGNSALSRSVVGIVAATPGSHETTGVRGQLSASIGAVTKTFYESSLGIPTASQAIKDGELADQVVRERLEAWLDGFVEFVAVQRSDSPT